MRVSFNVSCFTHGKTEKRPGMKLETGGIFFFSCERANNRFFNFGRFALESYVDNAS